MMFDVTTNQNWTKKIPSNDLEIQVFNIND